MSYARFKRFNEGASRSQIRNVIIGVYNSALPKILLVDSSRHREIYTYQMQNLNGAAFGEDFLCWLVTGHHMAPQHALANRLYSSLDTAGFDFRYRDLKIEVKTKGRDVPLGLFTPSQIEKADIFIVYNVSGTFMNYNGHRILNNQIYISKNKRRAA
jgi:hypothetical protein